MNRALEPLLRSLLRAGTAYLALFVAVHAVLALTTDGIRLADLLCLALVAGPQAVIASTRFRRIGTGTAAALGAWLVGAAAIGLFSMAPGRLDETYAAWFLGAIAIDLLGLAIAGRAGIAWATMGAVVVLAVAASVLRGTGAADGFGLVVRHVATLLVGTLLAVSLRRSYAASDAFRIQRLRRAAEEGAGRARRAARRIGVEQVLDQAGPTLQAIADGRTFTTEHRRQMLVLEGALRDQIRTPRLVRGTLRDAVADARRRGVNVLLMDEAEDADPGSRARAADWLVERLAETSEGGFVGRLRDADGVVRVSAVNDDAGVSRSFPDGSG